MLKPKKQLTEHKKIKQDKLVTFYFQALDLLEKYKTQILWGVLIVAAVIIYGAYSQTQSAAEEQLASVELARGKAAYESGDYTAAIAAFGPLTTKYKGTQGAAVGTLFLAKSFLASKNYPEAQRYFQAYLNDYGKDPILTVAAYTGLAATHDEQGDFGKAAELYEKAARSEKNSFKTPELLLAAGRCYHMAERDAEARRVLDQLIENHAESQFVSDAKMLLAELKG